MDEHEVASRASKLPDQFGSRLPVKDVQWLRQMEGGGELGELTSELTAMLVHYEVPVSPAEQHELRELLQATGQPTDPLDGLVITR